MEKTISIIGGDKRIESLARLLNEENYKVYTYGLENADLQNTIVKCPTIDDVLEKSKKVIGPIPITFNDELIKTPLSNKKIAINDLTNSMKDKTFILGKVNLELRKKLEKNNNNVIDILDIEEFTILNIIPTVEGAIQFAMQETTRTLHGANVLILGFGRIGKLLSKTLDGMGVNVTCEARKQTDLAWIKAYGYIPLHLNNLENEIEKFDIVFNTIPVKILNREILKKMKKNVIILELASAPGGIDKTVAEELNIKVVEALGLPGKVAPDTVAEYIKKMIEKI